MSHSEHAVPARRSLLRLALLLLLYAAVAGWGIRTGARLAEPLFLIPLLPLLGAAFNLLVGRKLSRGVVHFVGCGTVLGALSVATGIITAKLVPMWQAAHAAAAQAGGGLMASPSVGQTVFEWIAAGDLSIQMGLLMDPLGAVMVIVVTFVGFLIHVYSTGYMAHDTDFARFFGYLNLFTGAMLMLVLGDNLVVLFVGWEGVGVCSYLLIGFWYNKSGTQDPGDENATAGRKAFIVNRIGDFAFILGMFLLFSVVGTLNIQELAANTDKLVVKFMPLGLLPVSVAGLAAVLLLIGATGKSAQIPLYVWLPDAMAGPTPVSALIHAATMVTAGVYMVARLNFIYVLSPFAMGLVALVGAVTALYAATIGFAQNDIKKVLAYSTISQLGYMFLGVGVGAFAAGIFHLFTHAFFKACLFLGAGAVIHAMSGKQDIREMGGLKGPMKYTHATFLVSCLAIAGIPIFAGFFSKDEILWKTLSTANPAWPSWFPALLYVLGLAGAICTAFYMFRLYYLTFSGESRADDHTRERIHEQPANMTGPLVVLALGAAVLGFLGLPGVLGEHANLFHNWLAPVTDRGHEMVKAMPAIAAVQENALAHSHAAEWALMGLSVLVALAGIVAARKLYGGGYSPQVERLVARIPRLHRVVLQKYKVDELYLTLFAHPLRWFGMLLWKGIDAFFIDMVAVNGSAWVVRTVGNVGRRLQNGSLQRYVAALVAGLAVVAFVTTWPPDRFSVTPDGEIKAGERVVFDASPAAVPGQRTLQYCWDFGGDGACDTDWSSKPTAEYVFPDRATYKVVLHVKDLRWHTVATASRTLEVQ
jgi:NADH-quinone oxidoreductase subunit L